MTFRELLCEGVKRLEQAEVPESASDAWILLEYATGLDRARYCLRMGDQTQEEERERYLSLIAQRTKRIPVQQLTGEAWFMGLPFFVNGHVLIPRFDTEVVVERVLKDARPGMRVLDMCTGSGCILLSLLHEEETLSGVGADVSGEALAVAKENARRLGLAGRADFVKTDLFERLPAEDKFDVIVSNPPYIRTDVIPGLMDEVREHEPLLALDGGADGLFFYRRIVREAKRYLKPGGRLFFEIGYDQGDALKGLLSGAGYGGIFVEKDLAGLDRAAGGQLVV